MRYALLSDVHGNIEALEAVLEDIDRQGITDIVFLGDAVGYGPNPNECIELLVKRSKILLAGNHDWGAIGLTDITYFNVYARHALQWTAGIISEENKKTLTSLPVKKELKEEDMLLVHSTPKEPEEWHYLLTLWDAEINFYYFNNAVCSLGHSHSPFIIEKVPSGELVTFKDWSKIREGSRYIINAGSVGQPRDGDPRACYVIMDEGGIHIMRVAYNIGGVQGKMRKEHLPDMLIERLSMGR